MGYILGTGMARCKFKLFKPFKLFEKFRALHTEPLSIVERGIEVKAELMIKSLQFERSLALSSRYATAAGVCSSISLGFHVVFTLVQVC